MIWASCAAWRAVHASRRALRLRAGAAVPRPHGLLISAKTADLANLSGCELIESQFALQSDYARGVALDYFAEVAEQLLPPHEPNEKFFRLLAAALDYLRSGGEIVGGGSLRQPVGRASHRRVSRTARQPRIGRDRGGNVRQAA